MKHVNITWSIVHRTMIDAHESLERMALTGELPKMNLHVDSHLPPCIYQLSTNAISACAPKLGDMDEAGVRSIVLDSMAMCGCLRKYRSDMRDWNSSQNKGRIREPVLAMYGGPKWRSIRSQL